MVKKYTFFFYPKAQHAVLNCSGFANCEEGSGIVLKTMFGSAIFSTISSRRLTALSYEGAVKVTSFRSAGAANVLDVSTSFRHIYELLA